MRKDKSKTFNMNVVGDTSEQNTPLGIQLVIIVIPYWKN